MKTKKAKETCNEIIQAAEKLFIEKSISKVTINEIVKRAGVAKGTFYLYFDSKDSFVWHFIDNKVSDLTCFLNQITVYGHGIEDIKDIVTYIVSFSKKQKALLKVIHEVKFNSFLGINNIENKYLNQWIEVLSVWLEKGRLKGELNINDSKFMAYYLVLTIHEILERIIMSEIPYTIDEAGEELKIILIKLLK